MSSSDDGVGPPIVPLGVSRPRSASAVCASASRAYRSRGIAIPSACAPQRCMCTTVDKARGGGLARGEYEGRSTRRRDTCIAGLAVFKANAVVAGFERASGAAFADSRGWPEAVIRQAGSCRAEQRAAQDAKLSAASC